ncbi:MAG: heptosyltransferase [Planctomycetota bacterium]|nr:MAG: heptosyltransferase [Planctomycetota bacterium]
MSLASRFIDALKQLDAGVAPLLARGAGASREVPDHPRDALVVRLWGLGNLALLTPSLARFDGRLRVFTLERHRAFLRTQLPHAELLTLPEPHDPRWLPRLVSHLRALRADPPEVVVELETFLHAPLALLRRASRAPCVGLDTPGQRRSALLDRGVRFDATEHVALRFARVLAAAGLPTSATPGPLHVPRTARRRLDALLGGRGAERIVLHPGSGDHFPGRRWPPERFAELARALAAQGHQVLLTGTRGEAALLRRVERLSGGAARSLAGALQIDTLLALLDDAALLVSNDTGPLHLADALHTACVALYGPNTPHRYGPRGAHTRALFADLPCSPCLDDRGRKRSSCAHFACMQALPVSAVLHACHALLRAPATNPTSTPDTELHELA